MGSAFTDLFGGRVPYAVDNSVEVGGCSLVPTVSLNAACSFLSRRVGKCPLEMFTFGDVTVICQCDERTAAGYCTPSDSGPCWRALMEWLSDPFADEHAEMVLSEEEEETSE